MFSRTRGLALSAFWCLGTAWGAAAPFPALEVSPWNGHKAALSLTFDGGDPSRLDLAVPSLESRGMHGTFFLVVNRINRKDEWRRILPEGQEIGNFGLDGRPLEGLTPFQRDSQVEGGQKVLQNEFGIQVYSFAYPGGSPTAALEALAAKSHLWARGPERKDPLLLPNSAPDWMAVPCWPVGLRLSAAAASERIRRDLARDGWMVWEFGDPGKGGPDLSQKAFQEVLDLIGRKDLWTGSFREVGGYFRARLIFEKALPRISGKEETWTWKVPDFFPPHVVLRLRVSGASAGPRFLRLSQDGTAIQPDAKGLYPFDFSKGRLTLRV